MAGPSPREVIERIHRMAMDYDLRGQADLYAPDGVLEWPFAPDGVPRRLRGREEIRRVLGGLEQRVTQAGTRVTGVHPVVVHETLDPETVIVELELHGEILATGTSYHLPYIQVLRVRDGQIVSFRDYFAAGTGEVLRSLFARDPA
jgi:uncharacterized protein